MRFVIAAWVASLLLNLWQAWLYHQARERYLRRLDEIEQAFLRFVASLPGLPRRSPSPEVVGDEGGEQADDREHPGRE